MIMFLGKLVLLSFISAAVYANLLGDDLSEEKAKEIMMCFGDILCKYSAKHATEFRRIERACEDKEMMKFQYKVLGEIYGVPEPELDPETSDEYWKKMSDVICKLSRFDRTDRFKEFAMSIGSDYEEHHCETEETPRCLAYQSAMDEVTKMMDEYKANGVCCDSKKPDSDACAENAQSISESMGPMG